MIFKSIRWRIQAWHGLILILVLMGFGVTGYRVTQANQLRAIDLDLSRRLDLILRPQPLGPPPPLPPPQPPKGGPFRPDPLALRDMLQKSVRGAAQLDPFPGEPAYFVLWHSNGTAIARSENAPPDVPAARDLQGRFPSPDLARSRGSNREIIRIFPNGDTALAGRSMESDQAAMDRLALWLFAAGAGILLLGLAGGGWLASRAIRPIEDISITAQGIAAGDLRRRIDAANMDDELGRLAGVLNSTFARLEASFAQQARFTADASHELRTPLAVILSETQTSLARE